MKVAMCYAGRSESQPVLLNRLNDERDIDLYLYKDSAHDVDLLDFDFEYSSLEVGNVTIGGRTAIWLTQRRVRKRWRRFLAEALDASFDLVIGMNMLATPAIDVANKYDIPSLFFIRSLGVSGQEMYDPQRRHVRNFLDADFGGKVQYPFLVENFEEYRRGMGDADVVIANSEYVSRRLKDDFGVRSEVVYPPIQLENYEVNYDKDGCIAMVNPRNREKGADIFFNLVESMPEEDFISAGVFRDEALERRAEALSNLTHLGHCDNMREFYSQAKVVVVPSRWNEAFGRAAAEPMVSGIPVVVSDRGGLPEVVGDVGEIVSDIESIDTWKQALRTAMDEHDPEAEMERVTQFSAERQGQKFDDIVSRVVST